jgi:hypothetical protein
VPPRLAATSQESEDVWRRPPTVHHGPAGRQADRARITFRLRRSGEISSRGWGAARRNRY